MHVYPNTSLAIPPQEGVSFQWTEETARESQDLKQAITGPDAMLFHPDRIAQFELHVDAGKLDVEQCWLKRRIVYFAM